jgi:hypothetical protein
MYQGRQIAGSIFWEVRNSVNMEIADRVLVKAFFRFLHNHTNITMLSFLKIYESEFGTANLTGYRSTVDKILRTHNVPL